MARDRGYMNDLTEADLPHSRIAKVLAEVADDYVVVQRIRIPRPQETSVEDWRTFWDSIVSVSKRAPR